MALTGSMRDFGVSEIFQLIGHQKKSGVLTITDKKREVEIHFDHGAIVSAKHSPHDDLYDLASTLDRSGLVEANQARAAKAESQQTLKPLPEILLGANAIEPEELKRTITLVHQEIIYSLFLWKHGDYSFDQGAVNYIDKWTEPIASEGVLMDGYRIKDEWPLIEEALPDPEAGLDRADTELGPDEKLGSEQQKVYDLIDGARTAMDVVFLSRMGMFETLKVVRELIEHDLVEVERRAGVEARDTKTMTLGLVTGLIVIIGFGMVALGVWRSLDRALQPDLDRPGARAREALWAMYRCDRVKSALTVHASVHGAYPDSLESMVETGELPEDAVRTPWGPIEYEVSKDKASCRVSVPGVGRPAGEGGEGG